VRPASMRTKNEDLASARSGPATIRRASYPESAGVADSLRIKVVPVHKSESRCEASRLAVFVDSDRMAEVGEAKLRTPDRRRRCRSSQPTEPPETASDKAPVPPAVAPMIVGDLLELRFTGSGNGIHELRAASCHSDPAGLAAQADLGGHA
jgi:hypothetical protein